MMGRLEGAMLSAVLGAAPFVETAHAQAQRNLPLNGAEARACIAPEENFEIGRVAEGTFADGGRIVISMWRYYSERDVGTAEEQVTRLSEYRQSLASCSLNDMRAAVLAAGIVVPEESGTSTQNSVTNPAVRAFVEEELRRELGTRLNADTHNQT